MENIHKRRQEKRGNLWEEPLATLIRLTVDSRKFGQSWEMLAYAHAYIDRLFSGITPFRQKNAGLHLVLASERATFEAKLQVGLLTSETVPPSETLHVLMLTPLSHPSKAFTFLPI